MKKENLLSRAEMKKVMGGLMGTGGEPGSGGTCAAFYPAGHAPFNSSQIPDGTIIHGDLIAGTTTFTNLSSSQAQALVANGGRWCCESCSTASWLTVS